MGSIILKKLSADPKVKKFNRRIMEGDFSIDTSKYMEELDRMHATRNIRLLTKKDVLHNAQSKIVDALIQNQAYRSRCVEIKMICYRTQQSIEQYRESLINYLRIQYRAELGAYKTNSERDSAICSVLDDSELITSQLDVILEISDLIINDIDQASWAIKSLVEVLKLASKPETI